MITANMSFEPSQLPAYEPEHVLQDVVGVRGVYKRP